MPRVAVALTCCFLTGCATKYETTSDENVIKGAKEAMVMVLDTPAKVEFPDGRCFVQKINRPTGYAIPNDESQLFDYLVTGVVDVQNEFGVMQRHAWWVVSRLHQHGGFTNEGWGFDNPPQTQDEIDAKVSNWQ